MRWTSWRSSTDWPEKLQAALANYEFNTAANLLYEFFWGRYCDLYLETIKGDTSAGTLQTQDAVLAALSAAAAAVHAAHFRGVVGEAGFRDGGPLFDAGADSVRASH